MSLSLSPVGGWRLALTNLLLRLTVRRGFKPSLTPEQLRQRVQRLDRTREWRPPSGLDHRTSTLNGLHCEWFEPDGLTETSPVILYFPGGGFVLQAMRSQRKMLADLCLQTGCRGLLVQYRVAAEHMLPTAQLDGLAAYRALLEQPDTDPQRLFILGDSAGGNVALSTLQQARDAGLPQPAGAILLSPATDMTVSGDGMIKNLKRDPFFEVDFMLWMRNTSLPAQEPTHNPVISPAWGSFSGLPPLLVEVGSTEILIDGSLLVAERGALEGVEVSLTIEPRAPHVYPVMTWLPQAKAARKRIQHFIEQRMA